MRVQLDLNCEVTAYYLEVEGLRTTDDFGQKRTTEWDTIRARSDLTEDGTIGRIWITGRGHYVKKDGTVGLQVSRLAYGSLHKLPYDWQDRITKDLSALAERVKISE